MSKECGSPCGLQKIGSYKSERWTAPIKKDVDTAGDYIDLRYPPAKQKQKRERIWNHALRANIHTHAPTTKLNWTGESKSILKRTITKTHSACHSTLLCDAAALLCNNSCQDKSTLLTLLTEAMWPAKTWSLVWVLMQLLNICICFQVTAVAACVRAGSICQRFTAFGNASRRYTARTCCGEIIIPSNKTPWLTLNYTENNKLQCIPGCQKRVGGQVGFKR